MHFCSVKQTDACSWRVFTNGSNFRRVDWGCCGWHRWTYCCRPNLSETLRQIKWEIESVKRRLWLSEMNDGMPSNYLVYGFYPQKSFYGWHRWLHPHDFYVPNDTTYRRKHSALQPDWPRFVQQSMCPCYECPARIPHTEYPQPPHQRFESRIWIKVQWKWEFRFCVLTRSP